MCFRLLLAKDNVLSRQISHDPKSPAKRQHTVSESEVKDSKDKDEVSQLTVRHKSRIRNSFNELILR